MKGGAVSISSTSVVIDRNKKSTKQIPIPDFRLALRGSTRTEEVIEICERVQDIISACFAISGRDLRDAGRSRAEVSRARQIGMYLAHVTIGLQMQEVGDGFQRDRTTVAHACHLIEDLRDDPDFEQVLTMIERIIEAAFAPVRR
jgi:chromosomal replication initiation ATPase DnaA